jgi:hypothetical protein
VICGDVDVRAGSSLWLAGEADVDFGRFALEGRGLRSRRGRLVSPVVQRHHDDAVAAALPQVQAERTALDTVACSPAGAVACSGGFCGAAGIFTRSMLAGPS